MHLVIAPPPSGGDFARQRMVKSGNQSAPTAAAGVTLSGWASDPSAPAVIVTDGMIVSGGGTAILTGEFRSNATGAASVLWEVRLDGTAVASGSMSTTVAALGPTTITVADGERATVWVQTSAIAARTVQDGTWIDIAPA